MNRNQQGVGMLHSLAMQFQDASSHAVVGLRQGVGERIAARSVPKIFLLNGSHDRETSASSSRGGPMSAADSVSAVCDALNRRYTKACTPLVRLKDGFTKTVSLQQIRLPPERGKHTKSTDAGPLCAPMLPMFELLLSLGVDADCNLALATPFTPRMWWQYLR